MHEIAGQQGEVRLLGVCHRDDVSDVGQRHEWAVMDVGQAVRLSCPGTPRGDWAE